MTASATLIMSQTTVSPCQVITNGLKSLLQSSFIDE